MESDFPCEAYGPEGLDFSALCFFSGELGSRACADLSECRERMSAERQRVFARIQELAADGDEVGIYLAGEFTSPEDLLGGEADGPN
jgi:hypothetical protein